MLGMAVLLFLSGHSHDGMDMMDDFVTISTMIENHGSHAFCFS